MIIKGNALKGGVTALALHLSNEVDNDFVKLKSISGAVDKSSLFSAFREWQLIADQSRCVRGLYSISINPPPSTRELSDDEWMRCVEHVEKRLGFEGQPRAIVFHHKQGESGIARVHCHLVYLRVDVRTLKAKPISHDRWKLQAAARELSLELQLEQNLKQKDAPSYDHAR